MTASAKYARHLYPCPPTEAVGKADSKELTPQTTIVRHETAEILTVKYRRSQLKNLTCLQIESAVLKGLAHGLGLQRAN